MDCCSTQTLHKSKRRTVSVIKLKRRSAARGWERSSILPGTIKRRRVLQGLAGTAVALSLHSCQPSTQQTKQQLKKVKMGFCSYLICAIPFEVARKHSFFAEEGLEIDLIYLRGGVAPIQALVGGAVDYGAGSFDAVLQAVAKGAKIQRFVSTSTTPHSTLVTSPSKASTLTQLKDLEGQTVGVGELGGSAQNTVTYMMKREGADPERVKFALLGPNIYDAVRLGQVDAAMVNEPATTLLLQAGSRALVTLSDPEQAKRFLGGRLEGMGVAVRTSEREQRLDEMHRIARSLDMCVKFMATVSNSILIDAVPRELIAGGRRDVFEAALKRDRKSLIPTSIAVQPDAAQRAEDLLVFAGKIKKGEVNIKDAIDLSIVGGQGA